MVLFWRGWGISVLYTFVFWFIAGIGLVIAASPHEADSAKAGLDVQWGFAALFALHAASVFALALYRRSHPQTLIDPTNRQTTVFPHDDHFMFIRFDIWPYILLAIAAFFAAASLMGYLVFAD